MVKYTKAQIWQTIAQQTSALGVAIRTAKEVKDKWTNCKKVAKRVFSDNRRESVKTGGGPKPKEVSIAISNIIDLCKDSASFKGIGSGVETDISNEDPVEKITEYDSDSEEYEPALDLSFPQSPQDRGTLSLNTTFLESLSNKSASQISVSRSSCPHSAVSQISASFQTPGPSDISIARKGGSKQPTKRRKTQEDVFDMQCKMYEKELLKQDKEIERLDLQIDLLKYMKRNPSIPVSPSVNQLLLGSLLNI
ncbi:Hypothetical predicted protein [Mytilus galloprovincialis]|uniref:Myb/SANT-like DNA-binding domain-containing protein n=1 Tax=Mytilus galloprovincialis TaxID=29158 RepID=A0A8B6BXN8_MYTGA|nr:Hypothetical predicted protein [Mytilus galloprovincialis]